MKLIIPCAGESTRFPGVRPKWMLTHPDGSLMVTKSIEKINVEPKNIVVTILKKHEEEYDIKRGLKEDIGENIEVVILDEQTDSQPETISKTLKELELDESFLIKDSDNTFSIEEPENDQNYVCVSNIHDYDNINPGNKSYVELNKQDIITNIVEKEVISKYFNVGGYYFTNPNDYIESYKKLIKKYNGNGELYTSHIIEDLIFEKDRVFLAKRINRYIDWGTKEKWSKYIQEFKTYFIDLDGVLFKNAAQFFAPRWEDSEAIQENCEIIKELSKDEHTQIFFITARPESYRKLTEKQLEELDLNYKSLIMGCLHAKRFIVNDFSGTNSYPSCAAINVLRDSNDLKKYIK